MLLENQYYSISVLKDEKEIKKDIKKRFKEKDAVPVLYFSSQTNMGLTELKDELWKQLNSKENAFDY